MGDNVRLTLNVPADVHKGFKRVALEKEKTMTDLIVEFMRAEIREQEQKAKK